MLMYYCVCVPGVYIAYIQVRAVRSREEKGKEFLETSAKETHTFLEPEPGEKESSRHSQGETLMHRYTRVFWQARPWLSNIRLVSHSLDFSLDFSLHTILLFRNSIFSYRIDTGFRNCHSSSIYLYRFPSQLSMRSWQPACRHFSNL